MNWWSVVWRRWALAAGAFLVVCAPAVADAQDAPGYFRQNCASCHKVGGVGVNVAPDISDTRTKTAAQLLGDILQPNRAIDNNYLGYTVRLADGSVLTGILTSETATSITVRQQGGKDAVLSRAEIDWVSRSGWFRRRIR